MKHLLIVDGSNLLFQMFYGMPSRIVNAEGRAVQGTLGFIGALLKILQEYSPTHVAVLFDGEHQNERAEIDASYKANRADLSVLPNEETPFSQLPDLYRCLDSLGIAHAETEDCEADDWIASYVYAYTEDEQCRLTVVSQDSDLFQLIGDRVSVLRYRGKHSTLCTPLVIKERFGILPSQYADFKSLTGDASDNLKGAHGVGPKTAASLLNRFQTLEGILQGLEGIQRQGVKKAVLEAREQLLRNYQLIKLHGGRPLPFSPAQMQYRHTQIKTVSLLRKLKIL